MFTCQHVLRASPCFSLKFISFDIVGHPSTTLQTSTETKVAKTRSLFRCGDLSCRIKRLLEAHDVRISRDDLPFVPGTGAR